MADNQGNLARLPEIRKIAKNTVKFFHCTLPVLDIQGVFEVEVFILTCDNMRCSKEF
jgi:hypothetical protein